MLHCHNLPTCVEQYFRVDAVALIVAISEDNVSPPSMARVARPAMNIPIMAPQLPRKRSR